MDNLATRSSPALPRREELQIGMLRSAYLAPPLSGGGVRLLLIYPGGMLNQLQGTSLHFPEAAVARNWLQKHFPSAPLKDLRRSSIASQPSPGAAHE